MLTVTEFATGAHGSFFLAKTKGAVETGFPGFPSPDSSLDDIR